MLEKFLNKNVELTVATNGSSTKYQLFRSGDSFYKKGTVTKLDDNFIELDNNMVIQIKYIIAIEAI